MKSRVINVPSYTHTCKKEKKRQTLNSHLWVMTEKRSIVDVIFFSLLFLLLFIHSFWYLIHIQKNKYIHTRAHIHRFQRALPSFNKGNQ